MWSIGELIEALEESSYSDFNSENDLSIRLFDEKLKIGVGIDSDKHRVLILPGSRKLPSFTTKNASFDSFVQVTWLDRNQVIPDVATLRCRFDFTDGKLLKTVAAIFLGLIKLELEFQGSGNAIWEMKNLFEMGFDASFSEEELIGLIGELLVILRSKDPNGLLKIWHTDVYANFDFSSSDTRLEIKTTRGNARNHLFSSNQIGNGLDDKTFICSLMLKIVEHGHTLPMLISELQNRLERDNFIKLQHVVIKTLGVLPELAISINFDSNASQDSLRLYSALDIPRPTGAPGIISMNWLASLENIADQPFTF